MLVSSAGVWGSLWEREGPDTGVGVRRPGVQEAEGLDCSVARALELQQGPCVWRPGLSTPVLRSSSQNPEEPGTRLSPLQVSHRGRLVGRKHTLDPALLGKLPRSFADSFRFCFLRKHNKQKNESEPSMAARGRGCRCLCLLLAVFSCSKAPWGTKQTPTAHVLRSSSLLEP